MFVPLEILPGHEIVGLGGIHFPHSLHDPMVQIPSPLVLCPHTLHSLKGTGHGPRQGRVGEIASLCTPLKHQHILPAFGNPTEHRVTLDSSESQPWFCHLFAV